MEFEIKSVIFLIILTISNIHFAAGLIVSAEFSTHVDVILDNGVVRSKNIEGVSGRVEPHMKIFGYLPKPGYRDNVFITDGFLAGFSDIQWSGVDGYTYHAHLGIPGVFGFRTVRIFKDNNVVIDDPGNQGSLFFHKEVKGKRIN